ncbi:MAG: DUF1573 domain-containing protein [Crocinitomix sp.]|nr:DUF1573 domain-containing protein [Crocinitomix sp.]
MILIKSTKKFTVKLLLGFLLLGLAPHSSTAQSFTQMMEFADEKIVEGDYYYALKYYQLAMNLDSNSVEVLWKFAEAQRKYKDYKKAEYYYGRVYAKEGGLIYPKSIFWLSTMEQYNGKYESSLEHWKLTKKVFKKQKKGYEYKKSQQSIKSCLWAIKAVNDTTNYLTNPLPAPVNSKDAELAPVIYDNQLWFTSLKADSINYNEEVLTKEYSLQIYTADQEDSIFSNVGLLKGVKEKGSNGANGSFSPDKKRFYFSRCNENFECKIYLGKVKDGRITDVDSLGEIINTPGVVSTMPHSTSINGKEYLFFVSNREKSVGGLDIWYSTVTAGNKYGKPRNVGRGVNSLDDDISPFYDTIQQKLYFSSSWFEGFGGHDVFYAENKELRFMNPRNMGIPINSSQNDTYFIVDQKNERYYYSTNREGVSYAKNPTCCNDIFTAHLPILKPPTRFESLTDLNKKLPVTLFFHNDEPNPRTKDTTTRLTYPESYDDYITLEDRYKREYSKGLSGDKAEEAKEDINDFFLEFVRQGVVDLEEFTRLLKIELDKGYAIEVTVKGFASPLAKTDYNVNLTKRRISSLINYLYKYEDGVFAPYLDHKASNGGDLTFVQIPFGEYTANTLISDNVNDKKNSIYSRKAALERKIEIQSVSFAKQDTTYAEMVFNSQIHDFGYAKKGDTLTHTFTFRNTGEQKLIIEDVELECGCLSYELDKTELEPGEVGTIILTVDTKTLSGLSVRKLIVKANIENGKKEISVTTEVKD